MIGLRQLIDDVQAEAEGEEGDGKVDEGWVYWFAGGMSGHCCTYACRDGFEYVHHVDG